jgi:hypothetical protein
MVKEQLRTWLVWLLDTIKPPSGVQARRVVMAFTALVALGRAGLTLITSPGSAARINVVPQSQYAIVFLALFLALFWTREERRLTPHGFWVSIVGVGVYAVQAYDVWPVFPSDAYYALMALILLAEGAVIWRGLRANR